MGSTKLAAASRSPCVRLVEESLLLPTQDVSLFATTFLLIFAHTFVFVAVAVHLAHPLVAAALADIQALNSKATTTLDHASYGYFSEVVAATREHAAKLLAIYLAYLASKLATQLAAALATAATFSGERLTRKAVRKRVGGLVATAAFVGALESSLTALLVLVLLIVSALTNDVGGTVPLYGRYLLLLLALLVFVYAGAVTTVSLAASAVERGCHTLWALRRGWRLVTAARGKEAAVLVFVISLLPAVVYPVPGSYYDYQARSHDLWLLGVVSGSGLPSVGAQLFSMVTATVFCCLSVSMETKSQQGGTTGKP